MDIVITEWALDAYVTLKDKNVFSARDYWDTIRRDVALLKVWPHDAKFKISTFWSPTDDGLGNAVSGGFKMKWHQLGPGRVQLRLPVAIIGQTAFLCRAYVKNSPGVEKRNLIMFKAHVELIRRGQFTERGRLV